MLNKTLVVVVILLAILIMVIGIELAQYYSMIGETGDWINQENWARHGTFLTGILTPFVGFLTIIVLGFQLKFLREQRNILESQTDISDTQNDLTSEQNNLMEGQNELGKNQLVLLENQNKLMESQNDLSRNQLELLENQNRLIEKQFDWQKKEQIKQDARLKLDSLIQEITDTALSMKNSLTKNLHETESQRYFQDNTINSKLKCSNLNSIDLLEDFHSVPIKDLNDPFKKNNELIAKIVHVQNEFICTRWRTILIASNQIDSIIKEHQISANYKVYNELINILGLSVCCSLEYMRLIIDFDSFINPKSYLFERSSFWFLTEEFVNSILQEAEETVSSLLVK